MIDVTRIDDSRLVVNADLITTVEGLPDTVITLVTGARIMVKDTVADVVAKAVAYRRRIFQGAHLGPGTNPFAGGG